MSYNFSSNLADTCNEEIAAPQSSFGEINMLGEIDSLLTISNEDFFNPSLPLDSVLPPLQTLPDLSAANLMYNSDLTVLPPLSSPEQKTLFTPIQSSPQTPVVVDVQDQTTSTTKRATTTASKSKQAPKRQKTSKEPKAKAPKEDDKYSKRLEANKKSAQASRERKKALKAELEIKLEELTLENAELQTQMTELETENRILKSEFAQLQNLVGESAVMSKLMANKINELPKLQNNSSSSSNTTVQTAAALYLMVVLHSFGQHFLKNASADSSNPSLALGVASQ